MKWSSPIMRWPCRQSDDESRAGVRRASNGDIVIEDDVWIGAQAIILGGVRIGAGAIIGAAAVVDQDVPPYAIFAGNPGRVVGSVPGPALHKIRRNRVRGLRTAATIGTLRFK